MATSVVAGPLPPSLAHGRGRGAGPARLWHLIEDAGLAVAAVVGMALAIPLSKLTASVNVGRYVKRLGLLRTPEESRIPAIARAAEANYEALSRCTHPNARIWSTSSAMCACWSATWHSRIGRHRGRMVRSTWWRPWRRKNPQLARIGRGGREPNPTGEGVRTGVARLAPVANCPGGRRNDADHDARH